MSSKIKKISLCVLTLITPFLLSYKAIAVDFSQQVSFVANWNVSSYFWIPAVGQCNVNNTNQPAYIYIPEGTGGTCTDSVTLSGLSGLGFNNDYIFQINLFAYELRDREAIHAYLNTTPTLKLYYNSGYVADAQFMGWSTNTISESSVIIAGYFRFNMGQQTLSNLHDLRYTPNFAIKTNEYIMAPKAIQLWSKANLSVTADMSGVIAAIENTNAWQQTINTNLQNLIQIIREQDGDITNINNNIQESIDQTQQAADEGQTNSDSANSDNESASQNVIGVISSVIGAFNVPAGNCSYNVDLGNLNLGSMNFCQGKPPEFASIINIGGSILIVYACYRVAKTIFRIWLTMSVFAQGSGKGKTD